MWSELIDGCRGQTTLSMWRVLEDAVEASGSSRESAYKAAERNHDGRETRVNRGQGWYGEERGIEVRALDLCRDWNVEGRAIGLSKKVCENC